MPVPTNEQRRQAAKRKLERQLARRAERARRRRIVAVVGSAVVVLLAVGGIYWLASRDDGQTPAAQTSATTAPETTAETPAETTGGPCKYTITPGEPAAKPVDPPADPDPTPNTGTVALTLKTDQGDIPLTLDRAKAPCTVQSITHLSEAKFYDGSKCHRLVHSDNFKVLQCGGQGEDSNGGPGFTIPDEKPTDLQTAPNQPGASIYPRGVIAMANTGAPNSGSSQFFLVYGTTFLPPDYAVFGTIGEAGLAVLDKIGAAGHDGSFEPSPGGGKPNLPTTITSAVVVE
jgi:peptidyl-prolyl cis-trans isomerase B (cyclophilin B)